MSNTEVERPVPKALKSGKGFLWSQVTDGGEVKMVPTALGGERAVVTKRNIHPVGTEVTPDSFTECSDEQWEEWVLSGVVRDYPYPKMPAGSQDSPLTFLQKKINEAATSEEERLTGLLQGATLDNEGLAQAAGAVEETEEEADAREAAEEAEAKAAKK